MEYHGIRLNLGEEKEGKPLGEPALLGDLYAQKQFSEGWTLYRTLRETGAVGAAEHLLGARCARGRGDLFGARWALNDAVESATEGPVLGQVRFTYGLVLREIGEFGTAIEFLSACIQGMHGYAELAPVMEGPAYYNLGLALRQTRRFPEALSAYREAAARFRAEGMRTYLCMTLHNMAWVACLVGDLPTAQSALGEAEPLCDTGDLRVHQSIGQAFAHSLGGPAEQEQAMRTCEGLTKADHAPAHIRSHAYWLAGKVALATDRLELAESLARNALDWGARSAEESRCLRDAADLLREIRQRQLSLNSSGS